MTTSILLQIVLNYTDYRFACQDEPLALREKSPKKTTPLFDAKGYDKLH